jgi:dienelactone hydrolase
MGEQRSRYRVLGVLGAAVGMAVVLAAAACGGSGPQAPRNLALGADLTTSPAYEPVHLTVAGAHPGSRVTLTAMATDRQGVPWNSTAAFRADSHGAVDLSTQAPLSGSYTGADEMGLFWSMDPPQGNPDTEFGAPRPAFDVTVTGVDQGAKTSLVLHRVFQAPGVTAQALTVAHDGFEGHLFLPPGTGEPRPAMMLLGGSEGGEGTQGYAMLLASAGYPAMSVGYFDEPGTPAQLKNIPLEYFAKAAAWLDQQPGIDKAHVLILGASRGSEAALLAAQNFPDLVHGAVLIAPGATVYGSLPPPGDAWTLHGTPVADQGTDIPVDKIDGPILALAGSDDKLWASAESASQIMRELDEARDPYQHSATVYPDAGHAVGHTPYLPVPTIDVLNGEKLTLGGTRQANSAAQAQTWNAITKLLQSLME